MLKSRWRPPPMRNAGLAIATLAVAWTDAAHAQADGWRTGGSIRVRYEAVDGQVRPGFNASDSLVNLRTTLFAEYRQGPFRIGGEIYDSRAWGGDRRTPISTNEVNAFEPTQAYLGFDAKTRLFGAVSAQVGRTMINLGSRRLVAADDYRNTTNSYDGVRVDLAPAGVRTTLIYSRPVLRLPDALSDVLDNRQRPDHSGAELQLWGGVAAKPLAVGGATLEGSYFHLRERDRPGRPTRDRDLDTFGGRLFRDSKPGRWDFEVEALRQTGAIRRGLLAGDPDLKVGAGFVHAGLGYSTVGPWAPRLSGMVDVVSGDKGAGRYNRFDTLFGMRRGDYAPSGLYAATGRANLVSPGLRLDVTPGPLWDGLITVRGLWLQSSHDAFSTTGVRDAAGRSGDFAGTQVEGRARRWIVKDRLRAEADWAWLAKGNFLRRAPNAPATGSDALYVSLNLTAQF